MKVGSVFASIIIDFSIRPTSSGSAIYCAIILVPAPFSIKESLILATVQPQLVFKFLIFSVFSDKFFTKNVFFIVSPTFIVPKF